MENGIIELAIVTFLAAILGILGRIFKQPLFIAYLATGLLIGYFNYGDIVQKDFFRIFSEFGIMFLLFLVGLEVNYASIRTVGKISFILGIGQIIFTFFIGYIILYFGFGYAQVSAAYIALALTFSSTIIIVKLLSEKKDLNSLYGKISVGFMLVQDFVAIFVLVILAGLQTGSDGLAHNIIFTLLKGAGLFAGAVLLGRHVIPVLMNRVARSQELLFLISLAWLFLVVAAVQQLGFSLAIGGFIAGLALANSSENFEISGQMKPLKDFFLFIFFIILGSTIVISNVGGLLPLVVVLTLLVVIGNPFIVLLLMRILGYRRRTSFMAGLTVAQIGEFSLILAAMGLQLGHLTENDVALVTSVAVITITLCSYLIMNGNSLAIKLDPVLKFFERKRTGVEDVLIEDMVRRDIILVGVKRTGQAIAAHLTPQQVLLIDFDPDVVKKFRERGYSVLLGDIADPEIIEHAHMYDAHLVISTSPDFNDNMTLLSYVKKIEGNRKVVVRARTEIEARLLYKKGADYVIMPHFTAGNYIGHAVKEDPGGMFLNEFKKRDLSLLEKEVFS